MSLRSFCVCLAVLGLWLGAAAAEVVQVTAETPFLEAPDPRARVVDVAFAAAQLPVLETQVVRNITPAPGIEEAGWHPIGVNIVFHKVRHDGGEAWVSEELLYDMGRRNVVFRPLPNPAYQYAIVVLLVVLAGGALVGWHQGELPAFFRPGVAPCSAALWAVGWLVVLRWVLLALLLFFSSSMVAQPTDEIGYFRIAYDIVHGDVAGPWQYTIGQGLLYIPLLLVTGAESYAGMQPLAVGISAWVLGPALLVVTFLTLQKLSGSSRAAWGATLVLTVLPFVFHAAELHGAEPQAFKSFLGLPGMNVGSYSLYYVYHLSGVTGMSDLPSALLVVLTIWLCLTLRPGARYVVIIAALYGFTCLVRVNHVVFAPLLALLMWLRMVTIYRGLAQVAGYVGLACGVFLLVFSPQFLVNVSQNGGLLKWPYIYHEAVANTAFTTAVLPDGIHYLVNTNFVVLVLAVLGLLVISDRRRRTILALWGVPLFLFYAGYPVFGAHPFRWFLAAYGGLVGAFAVADIWRLGSRGQRVVLLALVVVNVLLVAPMDRFQGPTALGLSAGTVQALTTLLPVVSLIVAVVAFREQRWLLLGTIGFLLLWHAGSPFLVFAALCAITMRAAFDALLIVRDTWLEAAAASPLTDPPANGG